MKENIQAGILKIIPFLTGIVLLFSAQLPPAVSLFYNVSIPIIFAYIFYFSVFKPCALNALCVFLLGVIADFLSIGPIGIHVFLFISLFLVGNLCRKLFISLPFVWLWLVFAVVMVAIFGLWIGFYWVLSVPVFFNALLMQYLFLILSFPIMVVFCSFIGRFLQEVPDAGLEI